MTITCNSLAYKHLANLGGGSVESPFAIFDATLWDALNNIYALSPSDYSKMVEAFGASKIVIIKIQCADCGAEGTLIYSNVLLNTSGNNYMAYRTIGGETTMGPASIQIEAHETI